MFVLGTATGFPSSTVTPPTSGQYTYIHTNSMTFSTFYSVSTSTPASTTGTITPSGTPVTTTIFCPLTEGMHSFIDERFT